jgi:MFS family permease
VHLLGMAGLSRNVGFGANKVFSAAMLQAFQTSEPLIGFVLGLEGLFGLVLGPLTGWLSDRTMRRGWRRKVYVLVCLPCAAVLWLIFADSHRFSTAAVALTLFYIFQQSSVSPYNAWMPEIVPAEQWGVVSGYLNLWWQLGNLIAFLVIPLAWTASHRLGIGLTAILIASGGLLTGLGVPEPAPLRQPLSPSSSAGGLRRYGVLLRGNLLLYFLSQALAWLSFEAIASFFTLFVVHVAHGSLLDSALAMSAFTAAAMVAAVWAGRWYRRYPPKAFLAVVLTLFGLIALCGLVVQQMVWVFIIVTIEGVFWSANLTVAYALAIDLLGLTTRNDAEAAAVRGGLYGMSNFVQSIGLLVAAPAAGLVIRATGGNYAGMFLLSCAAALMAAGSVLCIRMPAAQRGVQPTR